MGATPALPAPGAPHPAPGAQLRDTIVEVDSQAFHKKPVSLKFCQFCFTKITKTGNFTAGSCPPLGAFARLRPTFPGTGTRQRACTAGARLVGVCGANALSGGWVAGEWSQRNGPPLKKVRLASFLKGGLWKN